MKILSIPANLKKYYEHWELANKTHELLVKSDWLGCINLCSQLIKSSENDFFGFYYRGQCKVKLKLFKEAKSDFEISLLNLKKNSFPSLMREYDQEVELRIANIFRLEGKYDLALKKLEELQNKYPRYAGGYREMAGILSDMGKLTTALDLANIGLKYNPNDKALQKIRSLLVYEISTNKN